LWVGELGAEGARSFAAAGLVGGPSAALRMTDFGVVCNRTGAVACIDRDAHLSNDKAVAKMGHPEGRGEGAMTLKEFEAFRSYSLTFRSHSLSG
jgi:hypothetical protein